MKEKKRKNKNVKQIKERVRISGDQYDSFVFIKKTKWLKYVFVAENILNFRFDLYIIFGLVLVQNIWNMHI